MKIIYKYQIYPNSTTIFMPEDAQILCVKTQNGEPCLWALHSSDNSIPNLYKEIEVFPTGYYFNDEGLKYIDTFLIENDSLVFHVFQRV